MKIAQSRLKLIREAMQKQDIDVYVMVNTDPHESEYIPDHWKCIEWLCGFRGEVATVIITATRAYLWTDSRFFISGAAQLKGTTVLLRKLKIDPSPIEWLTEYRQKNDKIKVAGDRRVIFGAMRQELSLDVDLITPIWTDRPALPKNKIEIYPDALDGDTAADKISRILKTTGGQPILIKALDEIAWTLNLRGTDILCSPVFVSYLYLSHTKRVLYIDADKIDSDVSIHLAELFITVAPYEQAPVDEPSAESPIPLMKAIKNEVEIAGFRNAMLRDGIALTRFYHWLEEQINCEEELTMNDDGTLSIVGEVSELTCVQKLIEFRSEQPEYRGESFPAIVAWGEHAALPHYEPTESSNVIIQGDGLLLIDTGGHYNDGTTDITRTIGIGRVSAAMKHDYTLVLKGHIRLARAVFPVGSRGDQLDALARIDLWRDGKTYRHGTSHGVGHYLNVHEGPESVRMEHNPQTLIPGMIFSNEPALYIQGHYGIRHENCVLVRPFDVDIDAPGSTPCNQDEQGEFLCLDTLTLCYIDTSCIDIDMLDRDEIAWLNQYNRWVYDTLSPHLEEADQLWLGVKCQSI